MTNEAAPPLALTQARGSPRLRQDVADGVRWGAGEGSGQGRREVESLVHL